MLAFGEYQDDGTASTMKMRDFKDATDLVVAPVARQNGGCFGEAQTQFGDTAGTLTKRFDSSPCADRGSNVVMLAICGRGDGRNLEARDDGVANAVLTPNGGCDGMGVGAVQTGMQVRRLTPLECERLQGFPDYYTAITVKCKPAADGPRYKALGNSMAVNVMRWIGERMAIADKITDPADERQGGAGRAGGEITHATN